MRPFRLATVRLFILGCSLSTLTSASRTFAQRASTAFKTAEISAFGGYINENAALGPYRDQGFTAGLNYTRFFHFPVAPSLEARANFARGTAVNEKSYLIGLRAEVTTLGRLHPYVDYLAGLGTVHYNTSFYGPDFSLGDRSAVFSYGGGINFDVAPHWQFKADVQRQQWRPDLEKLYPTPFLIGVTYRIPFKRFNETHSLR